MTNLSKQDQEKLMNLAQENGYVNFSMKTDKKRFCIYCSTFDSLFMEKLTKNHYLGIVFYNTFDYDATGWSLEMQVFKS